MHKQGTYRVSQKLLAMERNQETKSLVAKNRKQNKKKCARDTGTFIALVKQMTSTSQNRERPMSAGMGAPQARHIHGVPTATRHEARPGNKKKPEAENRKQIKFATSKQLITLLNLLVCTVAINATGGYTLSLTNNNAFRNAESI